MSDPGAFGLGFIPSVLIILVFRPLYLELARTRTVQLAFLGFQLADGRSWYFSALIIALANSLQ